MKLVAYCRVSTELQEDNTSLEWQEGRARAYCEFHGHVLAGTYRDIASGKNTQRPQLQAAFLALARGEADGIVVAKLDRLSRSVYDLLGLVDTVFKSRHLVILDLNVDTSTPAGRMVFTVLAAMAQFEREQIRERCINGLKARLEKTGFMGGLAPYGWRWTGQSFERVPEEQKVLQIIATMKSQDYSYYYIAKWLNAQGVTTRGGSIWRGQGIRTMVTRRIAGEHTVLTFDLDKGHTYRRITATVR